MVQHGTCAVGFAKVVVDKKVPILWFILQHNTYHCMGNVTATTLGITKMNTPQLPYTVCLLLRWLQTVQLTHYMIYLLLVGFILGFSIFYNTPTQDSPDVYAQTQAPKASTYISGKSLAAVLQLIHKYWQNSKNF